MSETVRVEIEGRGVARVTLDRAEKHNAMSAQMIAELSQAAGILAADDAVRAVVLTGEGKSFCAGGDLGWMREQMAADAATRGAEARKLAEMLGAWDALPKPVIGRVQGNAFGGGVGLVSVCDVAVGVDALKMGLTEVRLGLIPATIGPYVAARMGVAKARRVFFSGRLFGAQEAVSLGLLARAVPEAELDEAVEAEVAPYLDAAPGAVAEAKALLRSFGQADDVERSIAALVARWEGDEAEEGTAAFFGKRKAAWMRGAG
ncbi:crotonase/enoyl-CoA hydratase family protein [Aestuariibius insulae]|uniref:crotonase/enoyl-CoA hydratase family protein n=1 Tax=Aestuariibius insulae TaxID=2058287 RepID=UPI00345E5DAC